MNTVSMLAEVSRYCPVGGLGISSPSLFLYPKPEMGLPLLLPSTDISLLGMLFSTGCL